MCVCARACVVAGNSVMFLILIHHLSNRRSTTCNLLLLCMCSNMHRMSTYAGKTLSSVCVISVLVFYGVYPFLSPCVVVPVLYVLF